MANVQDSKIRIKRSTSSGVIPTVGPSTDHTDGTWSATDIYPGELFYNTADSSLFTNGDNGIVNIGTITKKVSLSSVQILALNTTPITLVAAPGVGKYIHVLYTTANLTFGTTSYATSSILSATFGGIQCVTELDILDASLSVHRQFQVCTCISGAATTQILDNTALVVETGADPTLGDSTVDIYITYKIITL